MTREDFLTKAKEDFKRVFPNGYIQAYISKGIGPDSITIRFGLIENEKELTSNIRENDPLYTIVSIYPKITLEDSYSEITTLQSGLKINPTEKYFAMGRVKTAIRKSKGDLDKLSKTLNEYFKKVAKIVQENKENIYQFSKYDSKYFDVVL